MSDQGIKERADKNFTKGKKHLKKDIYIIEKNKKAIEYFQKAANLYKTIKYYTQTADCFQLIVTLFLELNLKHQAAKYERNLGDIFEIQEKYEESIIHYKKAETYFNDKNLEFCALDCQQKTADLLTLLEKYKESILLFEKIADYMSKDICLKFNICKLFFKSILCHFLDSGMNLNKDIENIKNIFKKYKDKDIYFKHSDYAKFIQKIINAYMNKSINEFSLAIKIIEDKLDNWTKKIILIIKTNYKKTNCT